MDHDRPFKELLSTFFVEFLDLFLPEIGAALDRSIAVISMDKELFTDVTHGETHEVDVLMKARFQNEDAFFLIHVENQSKAQTDFPKRMFRYFARLTEKYDLPISSWPFSLMMPRRPEPSRFVVAFSRESVLQFRCQVIHLNRLP